MKYLFLVAIFLVEADCLFSHLSLSGLKTSGNIEFISNEWSSAMTFEKSDSIIVRLQSDDLVIKQISENTFVHISYLETENWGKVACNGMIVHSEGEVVVIDTPIDNEVSNQLIQWIKDELNSKIIAVVPTHFHVDCLGGLQAFHKQGILSIGNYMTSQALKRDATEKLDMEFQERFDIKIGADVNVTLYYPGAGHTQDNIVAYVPSDGVLFGGCLVKGMNASKGNLADANVSEWSHSVTKVKRAFPEIETVVPGHGDAGGRDLLDYTIDLFLKPAIILDETGDSIHHAEHPGLKSAPTFSVLAQNDPSIYYKIVEYENGWQSVVIEKNGRLDFEFLAKQGASASDVEQINKRRADWIKLCNNHNAEELVEELYSENAIYYNHRPLLRGRRAIANDYQYMNNPNYTLQLYPLIVSPVSEGVVFEIGQCSGSYNGKYILIWKKDESGVWRIFMDSNI